MGLFSKKKEQYKVIEHVPITAQIPIMTPPIESIKLPTIVKEDSTLIEVRDYIQSLLDYINSKL